MSGLDGSSQCQPANANCTTTSRHTFANLYSQGLLTDLALTLGRGICYIERP